MNNRARILIGVMSVFLVTCEQANAQFGGLERAISDVAGAFAAEAARATERLNAEVDRVDDNIQAFPQRAREEAMRLRNLGEAHERIEAELRRMERALRDEIRGVGSQVQDLTVDFDLNRHWQAVISGAGATLILEGIVLSQGLGPAVLNQFLDQELGLHFSVMDWMFVLREIESHLDKAQGLDCVQRTARSTSILIHEDLRNCIVDNTVTLYTTDILRATVDSAALYAEYETETNRRMVEIGSLLNNLHTLRQTVSELNSTMAASTTQMLRQLACDPAVSQCP